MPHPPHPASMTYIPAGTATVWHKNSKILSEIAATICSSVNTSELHNYTQAKYQRVGTIDSIDWIIQSNSLNASKSINRKQWSSFSMNGCPSMAIQDAINSHSINIAPLHMK
jgi:hypothetical protein